VEFVNIEKEETTEILKKYRADVPFMRPKKLAADNAKGIEFVLHAID
jgi:N-acylneuraminate cytidylyltransferase/CMP-N,N'-diacetyllegionaminic acid synthase